MKMNNITIVVNSLNAIMALTTSIIQTKRIINTVRRRHIIGRIIWFTMVIIAVVVSKIETNGLKRELKKEINKLSKSGIK